MAKYSSAKYYELSTVTEISLLPLTGNSLGDRYILNDTLYLWNGEYWAGIELTDAPPSLLLPSYELTSDVISADEGTIVTITLNTNNVADDTAIPYNISGTGISLDDITGAPINGNFVVYSGSATLELALLEDLLTEGNETLTIALDNGEAAIDIEIVDTSLTDVVEPIVGGSQVEYTSAGTFTWTAPAGVTSVSVVAVGGGGGGASGYDSGAGGNLANFDAPGGGGGGLGWKNNIPVVPGQSYTVQVGAGGGDGTTGGDGGDSWFINSITVAGLGGAGGNYTETSTPGGSYVGDGGGVGGEAGNWIGNQNAYAVGSGGGGAGGYAGNGGAGHDGANVHSEPTGGGGGGGYSATNRFGGGGGGVGIYGLGANGTRGIGVDASNNGQPGGGGSGGANGNTGPTSGTTSRGGAYGGGAGGVRSYSWRNIGEGEGGSGAVRIIWPGDQRQFPSTRTANEIPEANYTITVTNNSAASYQLVGSDQNGTVNGANPALKFSQGDIVEFVVNAPGHPFWIKTAQVTGTASGASDVTNNGTDSGTIRWVVGADAYFYICQIHSAMTSTINLVIASNSTLIGVGGYVLFGSANNAVNLNAGAGEISRSVYWCYAGFGNGADSLAVYNAVGNWINDNTSTSKQSIRWYNNGVEFYRQIHPGGTDSSAIFADFSSNSSRNDQGYYLVIRAPSTSTFWKYNSYNLSSVPAPVYPYSPTDAGAFYSWTEAKFYNASNQQVGPTLTNPRQ